jgi:hypothetical protein
VSVEKDTVTYGSEMWVRTHDAWVLWEGHGMIRMLLTGRTNMTKKGRSWLGADRRGRWSSKGVNCDILTQGFIGLIEYSYHQGIHYFSKVHLQRTPGLNVFGPEQF